MLQFCSTRGVRRSDGYRDLHGFMRLMIQRGPGPEELLELLDKE
jgi:hypothetical protein